jgi:hypothetical protein
MRLPNGVEVTTRSCTGTVFPPTDAVSIPNAGRSCVSCSAEIVSHIARQPRSAAWSKISSPAHLSAPA